MMIIVHKLDFDTGNFWFTVYIFLIITVGLLQEREKDRLRFEPPSDDARDLDRGGARESAAASRVQEALGVMNMASSVMGGAMNLGGGSLNIQLLSQLGIDPSTITNQVFAANVSSLLSFSHTDTHQFSSHFTPASYRGPELVWATGRLMSPDRGFGTSCLLHCGRLTVSDNSENSDLDRGGARESADS